MMVLDIVDLIERAYCLGWNDCVRGIEQATDEIKRDAGAQYKTQDLLNEIRVEILNESDSP